MRIIAHRRNTLEELESVPSEHGVEIDIRSRGDRLIVQHEPFADGVDLEDWLVRYRHATLILNVKESGLETRVRQAVLSRGIEDFFFLDLAVPDLVKLAASGERRIAARFSEHEPVQGALALAGKVGWVWVDRFTKMPLTPESYRLLAEHFRLCVVSPELHGRDVSEILADRKLLASYEITAVCTKRPDLWR